MLGTQNHQSMLDGPQKFGIETRCARASRCPQVFPILMEPGVMYALISQSVIIHCHCKELSNKLLICQFCISASARVVCMCVRVYAWVCGCVWVGIECVTFALGPFNYCHTVTIQTRQKEQTYR